jgi:hypothetical protein
METRRLQLGFLPLLILLAGAGVASAQGALGNATLTGTVVDNVGVVPGATVTATHVETNSARTATTNDQGEFRLVSLPPGRYTVKVEMDGFRPVNISEFSLLGGEVRPLGRLALTAGGVTESVTITAQVTPVQTANSALARNITGDTLVSVQVKGRDIFGMMKILPGVIDTHTSRDYAQWNSGRFLSINGGDSLNKNTTIDGVPVGEEGGGGTTHITPNIDSIGEVNVLTSGYNAEHGRQSSGIIQITTKSGTNQLRGSAWTNLRRDEWNKNDFFRIQSGQAKPFFEVNIGGYSIGGPVVIPKVIDSRTSEKRFYFFASQEFTEDVRPTDVSRSNLPTALERSGDFSQTFFGKATLQPDGTITGTSNLNVIRDPNTGQPFPDNVIPQERFHPIGRAMLLLAPLPNNVRDRTNNAYNNSNDAQDRTPLHTRTNLTTRVDAVFSQNTRVSGRALFDRDDAITYNSVAPGVGEINNVFPGNLITGSLTQVITPSIVNESIVGFSHNHWGFRIGKGELNPNDYKQWWQENVVNPLTGQQGFVPPRLEPFGDYGEPALKRDNKDEWPYFPFLQFSGGDRTNLYQLRPSGSSNPLPRWNENFRYTVQNDLSWTRGRHNFKFGGFAERDSKTEPGSSNYAGTYNFGHDSGNPLSTGNGYANALLGAFSTYTELDNRLDRENRHWYSAAYAQDSWRPTARLTIDYGLRVEHHGAVYESRGENSGFDPQLWDPKQAPLLYQPICKTGVPGNQACSAANQAAFDPRNPSVLLSRSFIGTTIPGTGRIDNGMWQNGFNSHPTNPDSSKKDGWYYDMPYFSWGPRLGVAWDVFGDGKTAIRASAGVFYNFINRSQYNFNGGPMISRTRTVRNTYIDEVATIAQGGIASLPESVQGSALPQGVPLTLREKQLDPGELEPERNYHLNVAFQRDIGFNTVAEVAYVSNIGRKFWRSKTTNNIAPFAYANPANLFNNEAISANFIRRDYPGLGSIDYLATDDDILNYNAMQVSVQRRLSRGLQMGLAYTLARSLGIQGWDFLHEELGGKEGLRDRYYGPPAGNPVGDASARQDRRHIVVINYSYMIPNPTPNVPVLKWVLRDWEASGVTQFMSGNALNPGCGENLSGINNDDPSLTGVGSRCELVPGEDPLAVQPWTGDPNTHDAFRPHFNLAAFRRPQPAVDANGKLIGNVGDVSQGFLRHPAWQNWDFTVSRRIPVNVGRGGSVRIQAQFYNLFNMVEFQRLAASYTFAASGNTSTTTGQYDQTTNPFNFGVTVRVDY